MASEQWVNLTKDDLFKTDGIDSKASMGALRVKFKTKAADLSAFKVKVSIKGDYATYSDAEKGRNSNFGFGSYFTAPAVNDGKSEGTTTQPITLAAAGGNEYEISAMYKGKEVVGKLTVETRRRLYFQVMAMRGVTAPDLLNLIDTFWGEADKLYIDLQQVGGTATVANIGCMEDPKDDPFIDSCKPAYTLRKYKPYAFAVCFIEHYSDFATHSLRRKFNRTLPRKLSNASFDGLTFTLKLPDGVFLWKDLDKQDDANKRWALNGPRVTVIDAAGVDLLDVSAGVESTEAYRDGVAAGAHGGKYNAVRIKMKPDAVSRNYFSDKALTFRVRWNVGIADGFTNGVSYNTTNLVAVATRVEWEDRPVDRMSQTIVHEVGHKIGMVPKGGAGELDAHAQQYTQRTHQGSHCAQGANWDGTRWSGSPICVMFGSSWDSRKGQFCPICSPLVRKLDLSADTLKTTGFKNTL